MIRAIITETSKAVKSGHWSPLGAKLSNRGGVAKDLFSPPQPWHGDAPPLLAAKVFLFANSRSEHQALEVLGPWFFFLVLHMSTTPLPPCDLARGFFCYITGVARTSGRRMMDFRVWPVRKGGNWMDELISLPGFFAWFGTLGWM
jgi:hypothetical protein